MFPRHLANDSLKLNLFALSMSELSFFKCSKLYSLNFAISHAQNKIVMLIKIGLNCGAKRRKKTDKSLETSSEINFEFIKFAKS